MLDFFKRIHNKDDGTRKPWIVLLGAALGVLLLVFGSNTHLLGSTEESNAPSLTRQEELSSYQAYLEERVASICESVAGVGGVRAVVTLAGGFESVYATELHGEDEDYVILGSGSTASGLLLEQRAPQIVGIGIVCSNAEGEAVRNELILLISASFGVPTNRIYVAQAKK